MANKALQWTPIPLRSIGATELLRYMRIGSNKLDILISIKPKYVKKIIMNEKKYEYRKSIFKKKNISRIYIYSTFPEKVIVGYFTNAGYLVGKPSEIWESTKYESGLSEKEYFSYFNNSELAYALKINDLVIYNKPLNPYVIESNFIPPQSYMYIQEKYLL